MAVLNMQDWSREAIEGLTWEHQPNPTMQIARDDRLDNKPLAYKTLSNFLTEEGLDHVRKEAVRRVEHEIVTKRPACVGCQHIEMKFDQERILSADEERFVVKAGCKMARGDGFYCPKRTSLTLEPESNIPAPVMRLVPDPPRNPDQPQTCDDAW